MVRKLIAVLLVSAALALALFVWFVSARTAVINWMDSYQIIDGFGGSCAGFYDPLSSEMADFFFTTSGIGLSLLRTQVMPSVADCDFRYRVDGVSCQTVPSGATILTGELDIAKQAVTRGVTVWSAPWSPPASMKKQWFVHQRWIAPTCGILGLGRFPSKLCADDEIERGSPLRNQRPERA
jgi:O-glycosyl hydrolase